MQIMYDSIEAIERVTHTLDSSPLRCPKCKQTPPLVSHGFVYKYLSSKDKMKVGKRLWCSTAMLTDGSLNSNKISVPIERS